MKSATKETVYRKTSGATSVKVNNPRGRATISPATSRAISAALQFRLACRTSGRGPSKSNMTIVVSAWKGERTCAAIGRYTRAEPKPENPRTSAARNAAPPSRASCEGLNVSSKLSSPGSLRLVETDLVLSQLIRGRRVKPFRHC